MVGHGLRQRPEPLLALAHALFRCLADGDVEKEDGETVRAHLSSMRFIPAVPQGRDMNLELPSCSCFYDFTIGGDQVALDAGDCLSNRFPDGFCSDEACLPFKCRVDIDEHEIDYRPRQRSSLC